jgi:hypothetical protein
LEKRRTSHPNQFFNSTHLKNKEVIKESIKLSCRKISK